MELSMDLFSNPVMSIRYHSCQE